MATKHLYSVVAKLISFWPDLNDRPTEWLTVKLKTNNNKPTKISHNFLLLSKFYAGLLILTLHLPEPWYPVCGMLLCVSLCIMPIFVLKRSLQSSPILILAQSLESQSIREYENFGKEEGVSSIKCCLRHILEQPFRILIYPFQTTGLHSLKGLLLGLLIL